MKTCFMLALLLLTASATLAQEYSDSWNVIAFGGGHSEAEGYKADGTIGQAIIGASTTGDYTVQGGFWGGGGIPCGFYIVGDFNGSGAFNVADIVDSFSKLKTGSPDPGLECECRLGSGIVWAVAMDVNNSCTFNVADVVSGFSYLKTGSPEPVPCEDCPPEGR